MIAVKFCCLNIVEVGSGLPTSRIQLLLNSLPYSEVDKGDTVYMCIHPDRDDISLQWPRGNLVLTRTVPKDCIRASAIAATPFWMEFDASPHFVRVQLKLVVLTKSAPKYKTEVSILPQE